MNHHVTAEQSDKTRRLFAFHYGNLPPQQHYNYSQCLCRCHQCGHCGQWSVWSVVSVNVVSVNVVKGQCGEWRVISVVSGEWSVWSDLFHHSCHIGHCVNHPYTVKLRRPSAAMQLRACGYIMYCQRFSMISTNKTSLFVRFSLSVILSCFIVTVQLLCLNVIL